MTPNSVTRTRTLCRVLTMCALLAMTATIAACTNYVFLPVDVAYDKLSPPYVVSFVNETGAPFDVLPSSTGTRAGYESVHVAPGESFKAILQLRRFTVGKDSSVAGAQLLDSPFFEHSPPDKAELRFMQDGPHSLLIAIQHPSWFNQYVKTAAKPIELVVPLHGFSLTPLFPKGPQAAP